jgi:hypothetical protein
LLIFFVFWSRFWAFRGLNSVFSLQLIFTHKSASDSGGQPAFLAARYRRESTAHSADLRHSRPVPKTITDDIACGRVRLPKTAVVSGPVASMIRRQHGRTYRWRNALFRPTLICAQSHFCAKISACGER